MTMQYKARYTAENNANTTTMTLDATSDAQAVAEVREIVEAGRRNECECVVDLSDGRTYGAVNRHGHARGGYL
jgi:hypothetical protein